MGSRSKNLLKIHRTIVLSTLRYGEEAYGSASQAIPKKLEPTHNRGLKLAFGLFVIRRTENILCEANLPTLAEMRKLNNVKTTIRIITPQNIRTPWINTTNDQYDFKLCKIGRGASNERFHQETARILEEKYKHHTKIYTVPRRMNESVT
jgi:hypothetical protein